LKFIVYGKENIAQNIAQKAQFSTKYRNSVFEGGGRSLKIQIDLKKKKK